MENTCSLLPHFSLPNNAQITCMNHQATMPMRTHTHTHTHTPPLSLCYPNTSISLARLPQTYTPMRVHTTRGAKWSTARCNGVFPLASWTFTDDPFLSKNKAASSSCEIMVLSNHISLWVSVFYTHSCGTRMTETLRQTKQIRLIKRRFTTRWHKHTVLEVHGR